VHRAPRPVRRQHGPPQEPAVAVELGEVRRVADGERRRVVVGVQRGAAVEVEGVRPQRRFGRHRVGEERAQRDLVKGVERHRERPANASRPLALAVELPLLLPRQRPRGAANRPSRGPPFR
jgi:hypothetical protein